MGSFALFGDVCSALNLKALASGVLRSRVLRSGALGLGALALGACAGAAAPLPVATLPLATMMQELPVSEVEQAAVAQDAADDADAYAALDLSGLPSAPWAADRVSAQAAPQPLLTAWSAADNRGTCAPLSPQAFGVAEGATARQSDFGAGWAVEFDRAGLPGVDADGESCADCGHGVFGIAGTHMSLDDLLDQDGELPVPAPTFADGSHLSVEPTAEGESVASANLVVRGQDCVYQIWSFVGEEHLQELVSGLRLVDVVEEAAPRVASR